MFRVFFKLIYKIIGWKVVGDFVEGQKKSVVLVAPHTSAVDFPIGIAARNIIKQSIKFMAKKELFTGFRGMILRALGGYPVDRKKHSNMVDAVVEIFNKEESFNLCITPEGTRKYAEKWKSGFYYIALNAKVPIVMIGFDFKKKEVQIQPPFTPTGNYEADLEFMKSYFRGVTGKIPEYGVR